MLTQRVISACILIPIVIAAAIVGGYWFLALVGIFAIMAGYEYVHMFQKAGYHPHLIWNLLLIAVLLLDASFPAWQIALPAIALLLILSLSWQLFQTNTKTPTVDWALTIAGALYIGWTAAFAIRLRMLPQGLLLLSLGLVTTWISDSAAYFIGTRFGKNKLIPRLSPKKTWEGLIGGIIGGVLAGLAIGAIGWPGVGSLGAMHGLLCGLLISISAPFGDLAISMMKRESGVKDSSHLIPGHGGFLDRLDSIMFIVIVVYYYAISFLR